VQDDDMREVRAAGIRMGLGDNPKSARIMAAVVNDDGGMDPRLRRWFLRGIVTIHREAGTLGWYLEHEPPDDTVWGRFHSLVSRTAMEMARERRDGYNGS